MNSLQTWLCADFDTEMVEKYYFNKGGRIFLSGRIFGPFWLITLYLVPCTLYLAGFAGVCGGECCCVSEFKTWTSVHFEFKFFFLDIFPT